MAAEIVIAEFMDGAAVARLSARRRVLYDDSLADNPQKLKDELGEAAALIVRNRARVSAELLDAAPNLKVVGRLGVGLDNIDVGACAARNVAVRAAFGANAPAVAEYVIAAAMHLLRPVWNRRAEMLGGNFPRAPLSTGGEMCGRVLGLVGFGAAGRETARRASALDMSVIAYDPAAEKTGQIRFVGLDELAAESDIISLHAPLTAETAGLVGEEFLAKMKPGAFLINTSRGGVVNLAALAGALRCGRLGGAALDVFEREPADAALLAPLAGLDNVLLTPHIAGLTAESNARVSETTADNVLRELEKRGG